MWQPHMLCSADRRSQHRADKQRGCKHAAGSSTDERKQRCHDLESCENAQHLPGELTMHGFVDVHVARSHYLGGAEDCDDSDEQARECWLKILRPPRE